ncbi:MAG TPA: hypothetical protein VII69_00590 [Candidatus Eremiobacteraceae bacterium]
MANFIAAALAISILQAPGDIATPVGETPVPPADALVARYQRAIQVLKQPPNMVVEYTQTRSGPTRVVTENHRIYRDADGNERNETTAINGLAVPRARVSIYIRPSWAYGADKFFVDPESYQIALRGAVDVDGRKGYDYAVVMKDAGAFAVTDLELDAKTAMPLRERFVATSSTCAATGSIDFGPTGGYWLPKIVSVTCPLLAAPEAADLIPAGASYRDTIRFSSYSFPNALPAQVFGLPPTPAPGSTGLLPP